MDAGRPGSAKAERTARIVVRTGPPGRVHRSMASRAYPQRPPMPRARWRVRVGKRIAPRAHVAWRSGDFAGASGTGCRLEPTALRHLMAALRMGSGQVGTLLRCGTDLACGSGLAGRLDRLVASDELGARVHVELLLYRIGRALEALAAALSGLDALVFTAHAVPVRARLCRRAASLGVDLDPAANDAGGPRLTRPGSRVTAWVIPADERLLVARRTRALVD